MSAWDGAALVLLGLLGGVLLVALLQFVVTLRALRKALADIAPSVERTARETADLAAHLNQLSAPIADRGESIAHFLGALERLGDTTDRISRLAQTAGAVGAVAGPAMAAAVQAVRRAMEPVPEAEVHQTDEAAVAQPPRGVADETTASSEEDVETGTESPGGMA